MDWFEALTGFRERSYEATKRSFTLDGSRLCSVANQRSCAIGSLETPSLKELRSRAAGVVGRCAGRLAVTGISGDIREVHRDASCANALFQVASQFNLLEMTGPDVSPEHGVTRYQDDHTQGPACAIAAGAATIYRNYFAPVDGLTGQTRERQIDCLRDVGASLGNADGALWRMRNGYALCSEAGLARIDRKLRELGASGTADLRDQLRIGLHWSVEATESRSPNHRVSQAFCSALPVSYTDVPAPRWQAFASLVLEGAYEATLWAAALNAELHGSRTVFLTRLGGGAFGNKTDWIDAAMRRALGKVEGVGLDVRIVSRGAPDPELARLVQAFQ